MQRLSYGPSEKYGFGLHVSLLWWMSDLMRSSFFPFLCLTVKAIDSLNAEESSRYHGPTRRPTPEIVLACAET